MLRMLLPITTALALSACVPYRLGAADLLETNAQVAGRGGLIRTGMFIRQAAPARYEVSEENVPAAWGPFALTRVESDPTRPLVVFCGGSAFRQDVRGAVTAQALSLHGDVWLFDYPGYGRSSGRGTPDEFDALVPALAARIDRAFTEGRSGDLVLWGHSFGAGVCARLAAAVRRPSSLVLLGAFQNYEAVVRARAVRAAGPLGRLVRPMIAPDVPRTDIAVTLADYGGAIVVAASREDRVVPFSASSALGRRLRTSGRRAQVIVFETGEHVRFQDWPDFQARMAEALGSARTQAPQHARDLWGGAGPT